MDDRTRIAAYLAGLVAVFGLAWALGNVSASDPAGPAGPTDQMTQHH